MKSIDKILKLIDKGDLVSLLDDKTLVENFNELIKYELIEYRNHKVILTTKGREARIGGIEKIIAEIKNKEELKDFSIEVQKKELTVFKMCLSLTLFLLTISIALSLTQCT